MTPHFSAIAATFSCVLLAACVPYDENKDKKKPTQTPPQQSVTSPAQQKIQAQRDALKEKENATKPQETKPNTTEPTASGTTTSPSSPTTTPAPEKRPEYKFANKVPGKDGFVFSPYNNKVVDVRDIPSGTLVQDPTYTGEGKGYFRVP
jgi:hypothetical protein